MVMEGKGADIRMQSSAYNIVGLTCENIVEHDARFGIASHSGNQGMLGNEGGLCMAGSGLSAARPKTCGLALALVAIFCYFPGISMVASMGPTNQTVTGIVFISLAGALTFASIALCLHSRRLSQALQRRRQKEETLAFCTNDGAENALPTNRDDCFVKSNFNSPKEKLLCECDEMRLASEIEKSVPLSRYFARLDNPNGPFDLDYDAMEKENERSLRCACYSMPIHHCSLAKQKLPAENSSTDSAIYMDSDTLSIEPMIVV